jgi:hypothetical protein
VFVPGDGHLQVSVRIQEIKNLSVFPLSMTKHGRHTTGAMTDYVTWSSLCRQGKSSRENVITLKASED